MRRLFGIGLVALALVASGALVSELRAARPMRKRAGWWL